MPAALCVQILHRDTLLPTTPVGDVIQCKFPSELGAVEHSISLRLCVGAPAAPPTVSFALHEWSRELCDQFLPTVP